LVEERRLALPLFQLESELLLWELAVVHVGEGIGGVDGQEEILGLRKLREAQERVFLFALQLI